MTPMEHNLDEKFESNDKRISKVENRLTRVETRVDKKHEELASLSVQIKEEREDISDLIGTLGKIAVLLETNNKDTERNRDDIEELGKDVLTIKATLKTLEWIIGVMIAVLAIVLPLLYQALVH